MKLFNFELFKKENRNIQNPIQTPLQSLSETLEQQSYCDIVQKQRSFLDYLKERMQYDAMSISPVFCAVNLISNSLAQMPWLLKDDGVVVKDSFLTHLFDDTNITHFTTVKNMVKDVLLHGNGFAYIIRDKAGRPISLEYLPYGDCSIQYNQLSNALYYLVPKMRNGLIEPINIIHFVINSNNGIEGKSVLDFARNTVETAGYTEKSTKDYFKNGMSVQGIIKSPSLLPENRRSEIRKGWNATGDNIRILEGGLEFSTIQSNGKEAELTENRLFNVVDIARFFNISPVLLGDLNHTQYGSVEAAQQELVTNTLAPYVQMMEQELNKKLLFKDDRKHLYIDIDEEVLIKTDTKTHVETISSLSDKAIITRNEARISLGYPPLDDPLADQLILTYKTSEAEKNNEENNEEQ